MVLPLKQTSLFSSAIELTTDRSINALASSINKLTNTFLRSNFFLENLGSLENETLGLWFILLVVTEYGVRSIIFAVRCTIWLTVFQ